MEAQVEVGEKSDLAQYTTEQLAVDFLQEQEGEVRTKVPTLDDVMSPEELEQATTEGLAANPEMTAEELVQAQGAAAQIEANMNYMKQQRWYQFMAGRPQPATLRKVDWGLLRFLMIVDEKAEFDDQPTIKALTDEQWYHGIMTGNVRVWRVLQDDGTHKTQVSLRQDYHGITTMLKPSPQTIEEQQKQMPRAQRRKLH